MTRRSAKRRYYLPHVGKTVQASNAVEANKGVNETEEKSDD